MDENKSHWTEESVDSTEAAQAAMAAVASKRPSWANQRTNEFLSTCNLFNQASG